MPVKLLLCLLYSLYNNYTDWKSYRIRNAAFVGFLLLGLLGNGLYGHGPGLRSALSGCGFMLCLFPLFVLRMMGAGDVKSMMAVGCMIGWPAAVRTLVWTLLCAGILSAGALVLRKNGRKRLWTLGGYIKNCWLSQRIQPYPRGTPEDGGFFRFSFGTTAGLLMQAAFYLAGRG